MSSKPGTLWIVATPLGNPGDLSPRAREILAGVSGILAEDTRRTGLLLAACGITAPPLISVHEHNETARLPKVIEKLRQGDALALVSDAGTPLLSDPGYRLVRACRDEGLRVAPVPGPSAPVAALSASGLPPYPFVFLGFAPRKKGEREAFFAPYAALPVTLIFFERKDRLAATLADASAVLGDRDACIARELTKTYEEFIPFRLGGHASLPEELLGEITVLVGPPDAGSRADEQAVDEALREEAALGGKAREVAQRARERLPGWTVKELYARLSAPHKDGTSGEKTGIGNGTDKGDDS